MENKKGSGIFLGVIGVATLIVAIIGATFAYFSASIVGNQRNLASAAQLTLGFDDDMTRVNTALIPSLEKYVTYSFDYAADSLARKSGRVADTVDVYAPVDGENGECYDDRGNEICGVYEFTIYNPSTTTTQTIDGYITVIENGLPDLYFKIYDETGNVVVNKTQFGPDTYEDDPDTTEVDESTKPVTVSLSALGQTLIPSTSTNPLEDDAVVENGQYNKRTYTMVMWIDETGQPQSETHIGYLAASITFSSGTSAENGVTGYINAANTDAGTTT